MEINSTFSEQLVNRRSSFNEVNNFNIINRKNKKLSTIKHRISICNSHNSSTFNMNRLLYSYIDNLNNKKRYLTPYTIIKTFLKKKNKLLLIIACFINILLGIITPLFFENISILINYFFVWNKINKKSTVLFPNIEIEYLCIINGLLISIIYCISNMICFILDKKLIEEIQVKHFKLIMAHDIKVLKSDYKPLLEKANSYNKLINYSTYENKDNIYNNNYHQFDISINVSNVDSNNFINNAEKNNNTKSFFTLNNSDQSAFDIKHKQELSNNNTSSSKNNYSFLFNSSQPNVISSNNNYVTKKNLIENCQNDISNASNSIDNSNLNYNKYLSYISCLDLYSHDNYKEFASSSFFIGQKIKDNYFNLNLISYYCNCVYYYTILISANTLCIINNWKLGIIVFLSSILLYIFFLIQFNLIKKETDYDEQINKKSFAPAEFIFNYRESKLLNIIEMYYTRMKDTLPKVKDICNNCFRSTAKNSKNQINNKSNESTLKKITVESSNLANTNDSNKNIFCNNASSYIKNNASKLKNIKLSTANISYLSTNSSIFGCLIIIFQLFTLLILLVYGVYIIFNNKEYTLFDQTFRQGNLIAIIFKYSFIYYSLISMFTSYKIICSVLQKNAIHIINLLSEIPEVKKVGLMTKPNKDLIEGNLRFENVSINDSTFISYNNNPYNKNSNIKCLDNFNLNIQPKEKVCIINQGNNNLNYLLPKLLTRSLKTDKGNIMLDNIKIKDIDNEHLKSIIGIVDNKRLIFENMTIKENILFGRKHLVELIVDEINDINDNQYSLESRNSSVVSKIADNKYLIQNSKKKIKKITVDDYIIDICKQTKFWDFLKKVNNNLYHILSSRDIEEYFDIYNQYLLCLTRSVLLQPKILVITNTNYMINDLYQNYLIESHNNYYINNYKNELNILDLNNKDKNTLTNKELNRRSTENMLSSKKNYNCNNKLGITKEEIERSINDYDVTLKEITKNMTTIIIADDFKYINTKGLEIYEKKPDCISTDTIINKSSSINNTFNNNDNQNIESKTAIKYKLLTKNIICDKIVVIDNRGCLRFEGTCNDLAIDLERDNEVICEKINNNNNNNNNKTSLNDNYYNTKLYIKYYVIPKLKLNTKLRIYYETMSSIDFLDVESKIEIPNNYVNTITQHNEQYSNRRTRRKVSNNSMSNTAKDSENNNISLYSNNNNNNKNTKEKIKIKNEFNKIKTNHIKLLSFQDSKIGEFDELSIILKSLIAYKESLIYNKSTSICIYCKKICKIINIFYNYLFSCFIENTHDNFINFKINTKAKLTKKSEINVLNLFYDISISNVNNLINEHAKVTFVFCVILGVLIVFCYYLLGLFLSIGTIKSFDKNLDINYIEYIVYILSILIVLLTLFSYILR